MLQAPMRLDPGQFIGLQLLRELLLSDFQGA
jgi:hypothetical protein